MNRARILNPRSSVCLSSWVYPDSSVIRACLKFKEIVKTGRGEGYPDSSARMWHRALKQLRQVALGTWPDYCDRTFRLMCRVGDPSVAQWLGCARNHQEASIESACYSIITFVWWSAIGLT